jgi:hypothetical protein
VTDLNLPVRFLLEVAALAALSVFGWRAAEPFLLRLALAAVLPVAAAAVWGTYVAPRATRRLPDPARFGVELLVFGPAVAALVATGLPLLGALLGVAYLVNVFLMYLWDQRDH